MADNHSPPPDPPTNGGDAHETLALKPSSFTAAVAGGGTKAAKRQRRPSVRLGDIGEQPAATDPFLRHPKLPKLSSSREMPISAKNPSRTRNLTHLQPLAESPDEKEDNFETLAASIRKGNRDSKSRRGRRIRSSWISNPDDGDPKSSGGEDAGDDGFRSEFDEHRLEDSLSPADRDRVRVPEGEVPSKTNGGDWDDQNGRCRSDDDDAIGGVRPWLNRLGLGRYAPVFDIHEVDDEVLPLLTLDDLKDMGINAVGSRRKMFCAIQKLNKNLT